MHSVREIAFATDLYSAEVVERAAYRFISRFSLELVGRGSAWHCVLRFNLDVEESVADEIAEDFRKEVPDQKLRALIRAQTETTRNLILAREFSRSGLV